MAVRILAYVTIAVSLATLLLTALLSGVENLVTRLISVKRSSLGSALLNLGWVFFYFPDPSSPKQIKEKASTVIISVVEGNVNAKDIELEFNDGGFFGHGWRCAARSSSPTQFTMRFPNTKEVKRACYWGKRIEMKTKNAILNLSPRYDSVGASAQLQKAWVRVHNIPSEKRNEERAAYVGSLVGVTLDIDMSTLHRPEYVRILIGCRDVGNIPDKAEGCLGDNLYIFYYEVDKTSEGQYTSDAGTYARNHSQVLVPVSEHESEEDSEEDRGLLIDQIIREKNDEIEVTDEVGYAKHQVPEIDSQHKNTPVPDRQSDSGKKQQNPTSDDIFSPDVGNVSDNHVVKVFVPLGDKANVSNEKAMVVHVPLASTRQMQTPLAAGTPNVCKELFFPNVHPIPFLLSPYCQNLYKTIISSLSSFNIV
ncbi:hypothetical protein ACQ4PT_041531 [Festuca glaucescens]